MRRNQVVVVTGASAGVGRATAIAFARQGAAVALLARSRRGLLAARREVEAAGGRGLVLPADVADAVQVEDAAARAEEALGPIDVWVNNAMTTVFARFLDVAPDEFRRVTEVTYLGYVHGTLAALKRMVPRDRGVVVQVGSALAYRSIPLQAAYCGAKHAIRGFTDAVRCELLHEGSRVHLTAVHLPAIDTPQFDWALSRLPRRPRPVPPIYAPEVAARAIVWAAGQRRREVLLGWPTVKAVLGNKLAPGLLDRYLAHSTWDEQMTNQPRAADRPSNLRHTVEGLHSIRGSFSDVARDASWQFRADRHRVALAAAGIALAGAGAAAWAVRRTARLLPHRLPL